MVGEPAGGAAPRALGGVRTAREGGGGQRGEGVGEGPGDGGWREVAAWGTFQYAIDQMPVRVVRAAERALHARP